jgi:MinD-like ATPase involved in chromosome partitioning or flagellar assembly
VLLAELDPAGGTLAAASGWPPQPGLVSLAAAARRGNDPELVWEHCHELPGGVPVLAGPASADQTRTALGMLTGLLGRLGELNADVLLDCGRVVAEPLSQALLAADQVVLVARPRLADLHTLATWVESTPLEGNRLSLVLVGQGPYPEAEVQEALGVPVVAHLPWDPDGAEALVSLPASARELKISPLVRAARTLGDELSGQTTQSAPAHTEATVSVVPAAALRTRVLRAWRPELASRVANGTTNGNAPKEASP